VDGRTLAVDWAVDKTTWDKKNGGAEEEAKEADEPKSTKAKKPKKAAKEEKDDELDDPNLTQEDRDLINFFKNSGENLEEEEDDEEEDEDEENEEDEGSEGDDQEDGEDDEDDDFESLLSDASEEEQPKKRVTDNSTTLFVRNLPYTATDETLKAHFESFGAVRYARVVKDRATDRPAGTGFVCFFNEDDFRACLKGAPRHQPIATLSKHSVLQDETADPEGKYTLDSRILQISAAVSKDEATRLADESLGKRDKDKRRLYLLAEGALPKNSPLYNKLTAAEIKMRETSAKQRRTMIQSNPALHLS
jgi:nucleolar protein 4